MFSSAPVPEASSLPRVSIYFTNEVLCRGVEAVLRTLPVPTEIHRCASRDEALANPSGIVITSASDTDFLAQLAKHPDRGTIQVLAIIDMSSAWAPANGIAVDGYLSQQDLTAATLYDALERCTRGEVPMPPELARTLLANANTSDTRPRQPHVRLTPRESETLTLLVDGLTNQQIARRLAISTHGAKRLVASIMLKLNASNRTAAVVAAITAGLVDPPTHA